MESLKKLFRSHYASYRDPRSVWGRRASDRLSPPTGDAAVETWGCEAGGEWLAPEVTLHAMKVEELGPEAFVRYFPGHFRKAA